MNRKEILPLLVLMCVFLGGCNNSNDVKDTSAKTNTSQTNDTSSKDQTTNDSTDTNTTTSNSDSKQQTTTGKTNNNTAINNSNSKQKTTTKGSDPKNNEVQQPFYGTWTISKQLASNKVTAVTDEDIKSIIGKTVVLSKEKANCFREQVKDLDKVIPNPKYIQNTISKNNFEENTNQHVTFEKLGIKGDTVTEISIDDLNIRLGTLYIKDQNTLILAGGGVFFQLDRK